MSKLLCRLLYSLVILSLGVLAESSQEAVLPTTPTNSSITYSAKPVFTKSLLNKFDVEDKKLSDADTKVLIEMLRAGIPSFWEEFYQFDFVNIPVYYTLPLLHILYRNPETCEILTSPSLEESLLATVEIADLNRMKSTYGPDSRFVEHYLNEYKETIQNIAIEAIRNKDPKVRACLMNMQAIIVYTMPSLINPLLQSYFNYFSAHQNKFTVVLDQMKSGNLITTVDHKGNSILHYAAMEYAVDIISATIEIEQFLDYFPQKGATGADKIVARNADGQTPVFLALKNGRLDLADALIARYGKPELTSRDNSGNTLWHYAAASNNVGVMQWLVRHGAIDFSQDAQGNTPLHIAMQNDALDLVKFLSEQGADFWQKNDIGDSPLNAGIKARGLSSSVDWVVEQTGLSKIVASGFREDNEFLVSVVLQHDHTKYINSALFSQARGRFLEEPCQLFTDVAKGRWPLHELICQPYPALERITSLLGKHKPWEVIDNPPFALSPLHLAAMVINEPGKDELFRHLLTFDVKLNSLDAWGYTIADHLVRQNNPDMLFRLLLHKSSSNKSLSPAYTDTLIRAVESDNIEVAAILQLFWFPVYAVDNGVGMIQMFDAGAIPLVKPKKPKEGRNVLSHVSKNHQWLFQYPGPGKAISALDQALMVAGNKPFFYKDVCKEVADSGFITDALKEGNESNLAPHLLKGANPNEWMPFFESYNAIQYLSWRRYHIESHYWALMAMFGADMKERSLFGYFDWFLTNARFEQLFTNYFDALTQKDAGVFLEKTRELVNDMKNWEQELGIHVKLSHIHPVCTCLSMTSPSTDWLSKFRLDQTAPVTSFYSQGKAPEYKPYCQIKASIPGEGFASRLYQICEEYGYTGVSHY